GIKFESRSPCSWKTPRYSYRIPRFNVSLDVTFQSSCRNMPKLFVNVSRRVAPRRMAVPDVETFPARKSTRLAEVSRPRANWSLKELTIARRYSPPILKTCARRAQLRLSTNL